MWQAVLNFKNGPHIIVMSTINNAANLGELIGKACAKLKVFYISQIEIGLPCVFF